MNVARRASVNARVRIVPISAGVRYSGCYQRILRHAVADPRMAGKSTQGWIFGCFIAVAASLCFALFHKRLQTVCARGFPAGSRYLFDD